MQPNWKVIPFTYVSVTKTSQEVDPTTAYEELITEIRTDSLYAQTVKAVS